LKGWKNRKLGKARRENGWKGSDIMKGFMKEERNNIACNL
jgi:hypothetical protein